MSPPPRGAPDWVLPLGPDTLLVEDGSIYRPIDGGQTWGRTDSFSGILQVLEVPAGLPHAGRIVAARRAADMAAYSDDRGASWRAAARLDSADVARIAVVAAGPRAGRLVAAGLSGLTTSDDGGHTWRRTPEWAYFQMSTSCVATLGAQAPGGGDRLVAVVNDPRVPTDSVYVTLSDDGGDTWRRGQPLRYGAFPTCVEAVDLGGGRAVAVMMRGPVWGTEDGGETWAVWSEWPPVAEASRAEVDRARARWATVGPEGRLYVGLYSYRPEPAFMVRTSVAVAVSSESAREAGGGLSLTVRPNPASSDTEVAVRLGAGAVPTEVTMTVHDARGREVVRLGGAVVGERVWQIKTSDLSTGVYLVRLATDTGATTASFTVVR